MLGTFFAVNPDLKLRTCGSDGDRSRMIELFTAQRVQVPDNREEHFHTLAGSAPRYARRQRKLSCADETTIRTLALSKSLRSLAADFGVSHETVRSTIRREGDSR